MLDWVIYTINEPTHERRFDVQITCRIFRDQILAHILLRRLKHFIGTFQQIVRYPKIVGEIVLHL
jgi:hypothetical protein